MMRAMHLWRIIVKIYEARPYPVVTHVFTGQSAEEAQGYLEAHMQADDFLRGCVELGHFDGMRCSATVVTLPPGERLGGGVADQMAPEDFDPLDLRIGTEHELEHTDDLEEAREIAMDHLAEDPLYYDKLAAAGL